MTDKDMLVNAFAEKGYSAEISEGVVVVLLDEDKFKNKNINSDIAKIISNAKYKGSWGMRMKHE